MIQERQFLNFIPPRLDGNSVEDKRRYMIVTKNDNNIIEMINISKISGKDNKNLIKYYNVILENFYPLKLPSFAKTNYIRFGGQKLNKDDFNNLILEKERNEKSIKKINFTKEEFLSKNSNLINV